MPAVLVRIETEERQPGLGERCGRRAGPRCGPRLIRCPAVGHEDQFVEQARLAQEAARHGELGEAVPFRQCTVYWVCAPSLSANEMRTTLLPRTGTVAVTELPVPGLAYWVPSTEIRLDPLSRD